MITAIDHLVLTVRSPEAAAAFYGRVLDCRRALRRRPLALQVGAQDQPAVPGAGDANHACIGSGDVCLLTDRPLDDVARRLEAEACAWSKARCRAAGTRADAVGLFHRPDGNLIEISRYAERADRDEDSMTKTIQPDLARGRQVGLNAGAVRWRRPKRWRRGPRRRSRLAAPWTSASRWSRQRRRTGQAQGRAGRGAAWQMGRPTRYGGEFGGVKRPDELHVRDRGDGARPGGGRAFRPLRAAHRARAGGRGLHHRAWNYPYLTTINTLAPALIAGNTVVLKHATQT